MHSGRRKIFEKFLKSVSYWSVPNKFNDKMNKLIASTDHNGNVIHPIVSVERPKPEKMLLFSFEMYDTLVEHCHSNVQYFERDSNSTVTSERFLDAFRSILEHIGIIRQQVTEIYGFSHKYDLDDVTPANGYRSLVNATHAYIKHTIKVSKFIAENRSNFLFRNQANVKEIETCNHALASLCAVLNQAIEIRGKCAPGSLFSSDKFNAIDLFNMCSSVDQRPFYGRCMGLHYCESIQMVMKLIGMSLAGFSELYYNNKKINYINKTISSIYNGSKYFWNAELRAKRYLELTLYAGIDLPKTYISLTEEDLFHAPLNWFNARIKVNRMITISPEPLVIENICEPNKMVKIPIPSSHLGVRPITVRLLSNVRREGMEFKQNKHRLHPMSNSLVLHCHGGGFIAHTSKSHEIYLRGWAAQLQVPILSVDYSLSPEAPYPRALEEVFYAYCWAIKNAKQLGTTAERIIVAGDSAGGALCMALILKCIEQKVRRPDGALLTYCALFLGFDASPSRLLCMLDVPLSLGLMMKYLKAYIHPDAEQFIESRNSGKETEYNVQNSAKNRQTFSTDRNPADDYRFNVPSDPFISPLLASDEMLKQLPSVKFVCGEMDPLIDDAIYTAKRLKGLGKPVGLDVLSGLPHGFQFLTQISKEAYEGNQICINRLAELLDTKRNAKY